jgi:hypothetical protein
VTRLLGKRLVWFVLAVGVASSAAAKPKPKPKARPARPPVVSAPDPGVRGVPTEPVAVPTPKPAPAAANHAPTAERESKIEFDERLVQGQTAAGAIYLFQRGESEFLSMIKVPTTFRERTLGQVYAGSRRPGKGR